MLLHLIDVNDSDVIKSWKTVRDEISAYSDELDLKKEIIVLSKSDSVDEKKIDELIVKLKDHTQKDVFKISSVTGKGISSILRVLHDNVIKTKKDEDIKSWQP